MSEVLQLRGYTLCKYAWFYGFNQTQIRVNLLLSAGCRSVPAACPAASVPTGCCQTEPEVASTRPAVPVSTMGSSTNQDRRSQWTATPGGSTDKLTKDKTHNPNISALRLHCLLFIYDCVFAACVAEGSSRARTTSATQFVDSMETVTTSRLTRRGLTSTDSVNTRCSR